MKIAILGYSGAGKSTLAEKLGAYCGAPVLHLDAVYWLPGWQERDSREQLEIVSGFLSSNDSWIIDGNYSNLYQDRRLREADRIILLLFNRFACLYRVTRRYRKYRDRTRPDLGEGCPEKLDPEFIRWILWEGRTRKKRAHYREIAARFPEKVVVLRTQWQLDQFEAELGI